MKRAMNPLILAGCCLLTAQVIRAQAIENRNSFEADLSMGINIHERHPKVVGIAGLIFAVEPKIRFPQKWAAGLRLELCVNGENGSLQVRGVASYLVTGDYYFYKRKLFQTFIGAGTGLFKIYGDPLKLFSGVVYGGMFRGGIENKRFRFGLEYNMLAQSTYDSGSTNYLGIKFGVIIGAGKRIKNNP